MISLLKKLWKDTGGNILVMTAAAMPVLIGSAGLATDTVQWVLIKRQLQRAADSAAISGAYERQNLGSIWTHADVVEAVEKDLEVNQNTGLTLLKDAKIWEENDRAVDNKGTATTLDDINGQAIVGVELQVKKALPFSSIFTSKVPVITASAMAASLPGADDYCIVALGKTQAVGIDVTGNAALTLQACGIMSNSNHIDSAINASGSGQITATVVAAKGGIKQSAKIVAKYNPSTSYFDDPYAELEAEPADMFCAAGNHALSHADNGKLDSLKDANGVTANCFSSLSVGSNKSLDLGSDKTIYIKGGDIDIKGSLSCIRCTIVLAPDASGHVGNFGSNAQANINMTAPETGKFAGIAVFQDRDATPTDPNEKIQSSKNKINGGATTGIKGVVYFPVQSVVFLGNSGTGTATCTKVMGYKVGFSGNNATTINGKACGAGTPDFSTGRVIRLIA